MKRPARHPRQATAGAAGHGAGRRLDTSRSGIANPGAHGFSETLYALSSAANNNGSAFVGPSVNGLFHNALLDVTMWLGRFGVVKPVLALTGAQATKPFGTDEQLARARRPAPAGEGQAQEKTVRRASRRYT